MVQIIHSGDNCDKINRIVIAAQKRFGMFGLGKTTMKEIAFDIGMSKASLYYYFPDKESLLKAVVEMEQESFFQIVNQTNAEISDSRDKLRQFQQLRHTYFRSFFNLGRLRHDEMSQIKPLLVDFLSSFRKKEVMIIEQILIDGSQKGIFNIENSTELASLFNDLLKGMRILAFQHKDYLYIENEEYERLNKNQQLFVEIFIKGIENRN